MKKSKPIPNRFQTDCNMGRWTLRTYDEDLAKEIEIVSRRNLANKRYHRELMEKVRIIEGYWYSKIKKELDSMDVYTLWHDALGINK